MKNAIQAYQPFGTEKESRESREREMEECEVKRGEERERV
jgi:hypothetical protein